MDFQLAAIAQESTAVSYVRDVEGPDGARPQWRSQRR